MRLLYQYIVRNISSKKCGEAINSLRTHVANDLIRTNPDVVYKFLTTSRNVEDWLQSTEEKINKMMRGNEPADLQIVIGGYGAGKSHVKKYLLRKVNKDKSIKFFDLEVKVGSNDIFSLSLSPSLINYATVYNILVKDSSSEKPATEIVSEKLKDHGFDDEFISIFCGYVESSQNRDYLYQLEEYISRKGRQIYLPLMKLYKSLLGIKGVCVFVDEFEVLKSFSVEDRDKFINSLREFYDDLANTHLDSYAPSFKLIALCTLSYWDEVREDSNLQPIITRAKLFEIPPLMEDEIIALAEKLYVLYKKSGTLNHGARLDFTKIPPYLIKNAGIESPLTPRFVIQQLMDVIEQPDEYLRYIQLQL